MFPIVVTAAVFKVKHSRMGGGAKREGRSGWVAFEQKLTHITGNQKEMFVGDFL
jgi:hypothetical protein